MPEALRPAAHKLVMPTAHLSLRNAWPLTRHGSRKLALATYVTAQKLIVKIPEILKITDGLGLTRIITFHVI
jgi:hypothetical protein